MIDEPDRRREIAEEIQPLLEPLTAPACRHQSDPRSRRP